MCLYTKSKKPKIAKEDIVCYKVFKKDTVGQLVTAFRNFPVKLEEGIPAECEDNNEWDVVKSKSVGIITGSTVYYKVASGGFHSFSLLEDAGEMINYFINNSVIIKCIIPKGTEYYRGFCVVGLFGSISLGSYASKKLILKEIVLEKKPYWEGVNESTNHQNQS